MNPHRPALGLGPDLTSAGASQRAPRAQILNALRPKSLLLILDTCEHLLTDVRALVSAILTEAPGVRVLVTSRERLNLRGEQLLPLGGLPVGSGEAAAALFIRERPTISAAWVHAVERPLLPLVTAASEVLGWSYEWQGYLQEGEAAFRRSTAR
jgi:hypothetical protein